MANLAQAVKIRTMLEAKEAKRTAIEAALAEAEVGRFVSEEAMTAWIDSWDTDGESPAPRAERALPQSTPAP